MRRTQPGIAPRLVAGLLDELGQAEVGQAGDEVVRPRTARQDHVVGLDVAVEDAAVVGVLHRVGQRGEPARRQPRRDRLVPRLQPAPQAGSLRRTPRR